MCFKRQKYEKGVPLLAKKVFSNQLPDKYKNESYSVEKRNVNVDFWGFFHFQSVFFIQKFSMMYIETKCSIFSPY